MRLPLKYFSFIFTKNINAPYIDSNSTKILSCPSKRYTTQFSTFAYFSHYALIYFSIYQSSSLIVTISLSTITFVVTIWKASRADLADISGFISQFKAIAEGAITQLESVVFLMVKGVVIPCLFLPSPSPILNPYFCIIFKAFYQVSSNTFLYSSIVQGSIYIFCSFWGITISSILILCISVDLDYQNL